jgi:NAD(P)-dependent dehydrogenase (short-subunit alcohol dehydrogenase family)
MTTRVASGSSRVAVVSGASSGVGAAVVSGLLEDGFVIVAVDLLGAGADVVDDRIQWIIGDVAADETWQAVLASAQQIDSEGVSALVLCAADVVVKPFLETTPEDWRRLFEVNTLGAIRGMQAVIPGMVARGRGSIAVVASVDSFFVEEQLAGYCASKAALLQAVRSAALEHARDGLRINAVCPGAIDTALFRRALEATGDSEKALEDNLRRIPTGKVLTPEEVAAVLRFLVSDAASGLAGAALVVDGGLTATYEFDQPALARSDGTAG